MIKLYRMDRLNTIKLLAVLTFVHATNGQTATVSGPSRAEASTNVSLTCTVTGGPANVIQWIDDSKNPTDTIYSGSNRFSTDDKYLNFKVPSSSGSHSVMTIENAEGEDDGVYRCDIPTGTDYSIVIEVEAESDRTLNLTSIVTDNVDMYVATCDAVGGKPQENITWTLNGDPQTDGNGNTIVETNPSATAPLSNTKSVFTFPATLENYRQTLVCQVSGHQITELNGQESTDLDIHSAPSADIMTVELQFLNTSQKVRVSCNISVEDQPIPLIRNYYIFSDGILNLIHKSSTGVNFVDVLQSDFGPDFEFNCEGGNYLGNTTTYDPPSTTTLTPTTTAAPEPIAPEGTSKSPSAPDTLGVGAIIGIVVGVIVLIVIIVLAVLYCKKEECCCFADGGLKSSGSGKKPAGSAVGSSNGSEKDKINQPVAAQRSQAPIQHTASNPGQELYALPERKQPAGGRGGDAPDRGSGPGQNEPQDIFYAALDLSSKAGHTEKHIPKNENDVVVYSSILV